VTTVSGGAMLVSEPWKESAWIARGRVILDSYRRWVGTELIGRGETDEATARALFEASFVLVSHGTEADPLLNFANRRALELWEADLATLIGTPSRKTAEPMHRDERAQMLERTRRDGYVDDYRGVRISMTGRRFLIERATIWNVVDANGDFAGQAAAFSEWTWL
jgi:hypothetical protein